MNTFQVSRRRTQRRLLATVALSLIVALSSYVEYAKAAVACTTVNSFRPAAPGNANSCTLCSTVGAGLGAAAPGFDSVTSNNNVVTYCRKILPDYYGTVPGATNSHATPVAKCPYGGTRSGTATTTQAVTLCGSPSCGAVNLGAEASPSHTCRCKAGYYGDPKDAQTAEVAAVTKGCTACTVTFTDSSITSTSITSTPSSGSATTKAACKTAPGYIITSADGAVDTAITVAAAAAGKKAAGGTALVDGGGGVPPETGVNCAAGKTSDAASAFCGKIAAGYYGTAGASSGGAYTGDAGTVTACTATFSHSSTGSGAITSAESATTTDKTACKTAPGYIITSADGAADNAITVAQAAAGKKAAGGSALTDSGGGVPPETAVDCAAGKTSTAGQATCTDCAAGKTSTAGQATCTDCAAGKYSAAGAASCTNCAAGKYSAAGATSCTDCAAGKTSTEGSASCSSSPPSSSPPSDDHDGHDHASATPSLPIATAITLVAGPLLLY